MTKLKPYIVPILILVFGFSIIYLIDLNSNFKENLEKQLALLLSAIGLVFGLFQVFLNLNIQAVRNKAQLRHSEYKELGRILNSITELLNENMIKEVEVQGLFNSLLNRINEYIGFIDTNASYLFPEIQSSKIASDTRSELNAILIRTDELRIEIEKASKEEIGQMVLKMNWHNGVRENLMRYNDLKSKLLKEVQTVYLK